MVMILLVFSFNSFLQSQANPRETMTAVLKIFQKFNVRWKKIGPYNMKCLWLPLFASSPRDTINGDRTDVNSTDGLELSITSMSRVGVRVQDAVRFEIQVMSCFLYHA